MGCALRPLLVDMADAILSLAADRILRPEKML